MKRHKNYFLPFANNSAISCEYLRRSLRRSLRNDAPSLNFFSISVSGYTGVTFVGRQFAHKATNVKNAVAQILLSSLNKLSVVTFTTTSIVVLCVAVTNPSTLTISPIFTGLIKSTEAVDAVTDTCRE